MACPFDLKKSKKVDLTLRVLHSISVKFTEFQVSKGAKVAVVLFLQRKYLKQLGES
jgi:hypothetical protein